jgi:hypothetical protein
MNRPTTSTAIPTRALKSRRLHAGCHLGRNQAIPQTRPGVTTSPRFRHRRYAFDTSSAVGLNGFAVEGVVVQDCVLGYLVGAGKEVCGGNFDCPGEIFDRAVLAASVSKILPRLK